MKRFFTLLATFSIFTCTQLMAMPITENQEKIVAETKKQDTGKLALIPYPANLKITQEGTFKIKDLKGINCIDKQMTAHLNDFAAQLKKTSDIALKITDKEKQQKNSINFSVDSKLPAEGYTMTVSKKGIDIKASQTAGFFYALQTLKQLLPQAYFGNEVNKDADWSIPFVDIKDQPQMGHRGFMLDVARHFFDKKEVMRILDMMALYKFNLFHWHLTDDQGWRIEIPEYPKLTDTGAIRKGSFVSPGEGTKFFDDTEYGRGMFYTQEDLKEIVAYAQARHIDILPEVDFPGHMVAAVTAYPELSCDFKKKYEVRLDAGISKDVLNIGNDNVIGFLKCIMDNLADIFPYPYVHFGGDECPTEQWATNEDCLRRVKEENLKGVNELQSWLVEELGTYIKEKHNKDIMVWDELLEHWNTNNKIKPVVMAWRNINKSKDAARKGLKCIVCPHQYLYLDMMQVTKDKALIDEIYYGGWNDDKVNTVKTIYDLNPTAALNGQEDYCLGIQANMWTETTNDKEELEYQLFPRLIATAETAWLPAKSKSWKSFYNRLQSHDEIMDAKGITYAKHFFETDTISESEQTMAEAESILANSICNGVGYPAKKHYDNLKDALKEAKEKEGKGKGKYMTTLKKAMDTYKKISIQQPQSSKYYQIISASSYYKKQFEGSTLYATENGARIHYTPQNEPEELWQFVAAEKGFYLVNAATKKRLQLSELGKAVTMVDDFGTAIRIDKATVPTRNINYLPGVITISEVEGYSAYEINHVRRLVAQLSGNVHAEDNAALCYPGTWRIKEITDFSPLLKALNAKCEKIIQQVELNKDGALSAEAIVFLNNKILSPLKGALNEKVTVEIYQHYLDLYHEFLSIPAAQKE